MGNRRRINTNKCFMVVSLDGTITSLESPEEREKSLRRAKFEKDYKKKQVIRAKVGKLSTELEAFSLGIEEQIAKFRANRSN